MEGDTAGRNKTFFRWWSEAAFLTDGTNTTVLAGRSEALARSLPQNGRREAAADRPWDGLQIDRAPRQIRGAPQRAQGGLRLELHLPPTTTRR